MRRPGDAAIVAIAILAALGFALIITPQWLAHEALAGSRDTLFSAAAARLDEGLDLRFITNPDPTTKRLRKYAQSLQETSLWLYSPAQAIVLALQVAGTMATIFLHA